MVECRIKFDVPLPNGKRLEREYRADHYPAAKGERTAVKGDQASNCCHAKLNSKKFCSACSEAQPWTTEWRLVKTGAKEFKPLEKRRFDEAEERLPEKGLFVVRTLRSIDAVRAADDRVAKTMYLAPQEKGEAEYCEAVAILKDTAAVGSMTLRSNNYEGVLDVVQRNGAEFLRIRLLIEDGQYNGVPQVAQMEVGGAKVELLRKVLGSAKSDEPYDFSQFRDVAVAECERLVETLALGGELPELKQEAMAQKSADEEAELKALAEGL